MYKTVYNNSNGFKEKLLSGIVWRATNVLVAFIFNALLVRQMGAAATGGFFYLLNNLFFAVLLLSIGLESGISFYNARKEISISFLFSAGIVWSIIGAFIFFGLVQLFHGQIGQSKYGYIFLTLYVFGSMLNTFLSAIYFTNHNSKAPNLLAALTNIMLILLLPNMPWINGSIGFETYVLIYLSAVLLSPVVLAFLLLQNKVVFSFAGFKTNALKPLLLFSFHSFIIGLLFSLLKRSDYWLVNKWCSISEAGNYFQASKVIQLVLLLPALASFSLYPLIVQSIKKDENNQVQTETETTILKLVGLYFFIALLLSLAIIIAGYWVFPLLYGATFNNLYMAILFLIPGLIFFAATYPLTVFFSGKNQNVTTIIFLSISIAVLVLSNVILTPAYYIYGASISNSLANFVFFFLLLRKFLVQNKLSFKINQFIYPINVKAILKGLGNIK
jgi:O-antigen/teichoic acid export membrane protein